MGIPNAFPLNPHQIIPIAVEQHLNISQTFIIDLELMSRHKDEQHNHTNTNQDRAQQDHGSPLGHQFANIRFPDARPVHERVFTQTDESEDGVDGVLLGGEGVDADGEGEDELLEEKQCVSIINKPRKCNSLREGKGLPSSGCALAH